MQGLKHDERQPVLTIGASAISTDLAHMQSYRASRIFTRLTEPYLGGLQEATHFHYLGAGEQEASTYRWEEFVRNAFGMQDWHYKPENDSIRRVRPQEDSHTNFFGPVLREQTNFAAFKDGLSKELVRLDRFFKQHLSKEAARRQTAVLGLAQDVLDNQIEAWRDVLQEGQNQDEGLLRRAALGQVLAFLDGFRGALSDKPLVDARGKPISTVYALDNDGWHARADIVAVYAKMVQLKVDRLRQRTGDAFQVIVRSLAALPILALLLQALTSMSEWQTWGWPFVALVVLGVAEVISWRDRLIREQLNAFTLRLKAVRPLVLGIASRHTEQAQDSIRDRIADSYNQLDTLLDYLNYRLNEHEENLKLVTSKARAESAQDTQLLEYYLYDLPYCDDWAELAVQQGPAFAGYRKEDTARPPSGRKCAATG
jgi:hypothetical protein